MSIVLAIFNYSPVLFYFTCRIIDISFCNICDFVTDKITKKNEEKVIKE